MSISRVAALYDIHGNLPALEAVLAEVDALAPDLIVIGGDVVPGPMPLAVLDLLGGLGDRARFVRGNADREVVETFDGGRPATVFSDVAQRAVTWTAEQIAPGHREFLASFEETVSMELDGLGQVLFCHGSPRSDFETITSVTPPDRLAEIVRGVDAPTVVCGHTHRQFDLTVGDRRVLNAGSVGMPYEGDAAAFWLVLGADVEMRRTEYDVRAAVTAMRETDFPDLEEMLRESFIEPVDPDWVAEYFEAIATGGEPPPPPDSAT